MTFSQNFLYPTGFVFKLSKTPGVEYSVQSLTIPGISIGTIERPTPFIKLYEKGNITYSQLVVNFTVLDDLSNYLELVNWMTQLGHPDTFSQTDHTVYDASVIILDRNKKACGSKEIKFTDVFPINLSELNMDVTISEPSPVTASAVFAFDSMYYI